MTAVTETFRKVAVVGDLKLISIQTDANCASGFTIDLNTDVADGRGQVVQEILNSVLQDDAGADKEGTWDPATGIYTVGTVSTGIHNLFIVAR